jgi:Rieske Fe-S protein
MVQGHPAPPTRREFLGCACRCSAGLAVLSLLPSCASEPEVHGPRLDWSELPDGSRIIVMDGSLPIEVSRAGEVVRARSLLCTHQGCEVKWEDDPGHYVCPCHEGIFDASGQPVLGPPREPLREFAVERTNGSVQIDTRAPRGAE